MYLNFEYNHKCKKEEKKKYEDPKALGEKRVKEKHPQTKNLLPVTYSICLDSFDGIFFLYI